MNQPKDTPEVAIPELTLDGLNAKYKNLIFTMNNEVISVYDVVRLEWVTDSQGVKRLRLYLMDGQSKVSLSAGESKMAFNKWLKYRGTA